MKQQPKRQRRQRSRTANVNFQQIVDTVGVNVPAGQSVSITRATLTSIPSGRGFRPMAIHFQSAAYAGTNQGTGYASLTMCDLVLASNTSTQSTSTGTFLVGPNPSKRVLRMPPSGDWFTGPISSTTVIATVNNICASTSADPNQGNILGVLKFVIHLMPEDQSPACPTIRVLHPSDSTTEPDEDGFLHCKPFAILTPANSGTPRSSVPDFAKVLEK